LMGAEVFVPEAGDFRAFAVEGVGDEGRTEVARRPVLGIREDVEVAVEDEGAAEEGGEDFLVEFGAEGEVGAGELSELGVNGVDEGNPSVGVFIGDVEDG